MKFSYEITDVFNCSLERAFKAPILGDATKFMKGYLFQPPVTGFEDDETWGQINGIRYPINNGNLFVKKGRMFKDVILERTENSYWKWTIYDFEFKSLFFASKAIGEWHVKRLNENNAWVPFYLDLKFVQYQLLAFGTPRNFLREMLFFSLDLSEISAWLAKLHS